MCISLTPDRLLCMNVKILSVHIRSVDSSSVVQLLHLFGTSYLFVVLFLELQGSVKVECDVWNAKNEN